jgi:thioredoxin-like negative regulator of GroEL
MPPGPAGLAPLDEFSFHQRLAASGGVALVIFTSPGRGSCRAWKRMLANYPPEWGEGLRIFEVDAGRAQGLAREFGVHHLPALFLYRDGHYHGALECAADPASLRAAISAVLAAPAQEPP